MKYTRAQRLKGEVSHEEYWGQFATDYLKKAVISEFGIRRLCAAFEIGEHFNSIPLEKWDRLGEIYTQYIGRLIHETNDGWVTSSDLVCTLKAAARQVVLEDLAVDTLGGGS